MGNGFRSRICTFGEPQHCSPAGVVADYRSVCWARLYADNAYQILEHHPPNSLLFLDCADTYIVRTRSRTELLYARSHVVNAAKAFGIQAIDMACVNYKDPDLLREESEDGRRLGFDGKVLKYPSTVRGHID